MTREPSQLRPAISVREAATRRVRVSTGVALLAAAALTGAFTALAAASTHAKKIVRRLETRRPAAHRLAPVIAPAPPLVQLGSSSAAPPPAAPAPAPAPATAPPVVVSGGS
ncbi:MAG TPA: hypothetical protein VFU51_07525 [Gaiellaceae bacterium]|nr:hypothetical protein [Gaiellaceae bacterium]